VEIVLGDKLDKQDNIRCSQWSKQQLSKEQRVYVALDVIRPLQAYKRMASLPNLAQRLNPTQAASLWLAEGALQDEVRLDIPLVVLVHLLQRLG
jgi:ribonuclease D